MQFFDNVKIPVFGSDMPTPATWVDPASPPTAGYYFTDADWLRSTNVIRKNGVVEGIARSVDYNTVLRQCSTMTSLFANILAYRNSETRNGVYPYKDVDSPIGTDFNGELNFAAHIGALSEIFSREKFLFDNEVKTRTIENLSITTEKLANSTGVLDGITEAKIATDAISKSKLGGDLINTAEATENGITVKLSQGANSGNHGLQIGVVSSKVTNATNSDNATNSNKLITSPSTGNIYIAGPTSFDAGTAKSFLNTGSVFISGGNTLNANAFNIVSDLRLKENIKDVGHNQVKALVEHVDIKTYNYKNLKNVTYLGVIAQELLAANTVIGNLLVDKDEKGFYSVKESKLVYVLWDYIKQLEKRVRDLEGK